MSYLFPIANGTELGAVSAGTNITIVDGVVSSTGGGGSTIGTWTPSISVSTAGTITVTTATATYAKMGQQVICYFDITLATKADGSNANTLTLDGLPFASIAGTGIQGSLGVSIFANLRTDQSRISGTVAGSSTSALLYTIHNDKNNVRLTYADVQATPAATRLVGTITYLSAT